LTVLDEILAHKRRELAEARRRLPPAQLAELARGRAEPVRDFRAACLSAPAPRIVAEIKGRSPSRGEIRPDLDPVGCAKEYAENGAACLSVLTDERFFGGSLAFLEAIRRAVALPLLRKDFLIDSYQVDESRARGADAVLLIAAALEADALRGLLARAREHGLAALVEVHDERELEGALAAGADLVGINNRDLRSFEVDLAVTERLAPLVPRGVAVVAESGIVSHADLLRLGAAGAHAFLVGESLMRERELGAALRALREAS
jgi:indole-3-glycerol phosphate synthase